MADKITKIASSYDMVSIMRDIGANYFGSDLSEQRIGMFGYLTESAANMFGAAILDASIRQQEYNSCTAKKRSTLLYDGAKLNINVDNATPSKMTAYLGVLTTSIINPSHKGGFGTAIVSGDTNNPDYLLVIEKDTNINIANYNFMVEHDIQIRATYNPVTESYTYSVRYLLEGDVDNTSLSYPDGYKVPRYVTAYEIDDKYIQSYVHAYNKDISILLFKVELVQISKETTNYQIVKNDLVSLTGLDFPFSNELSHFNVFYRKNNNSSWENIKTVPVYDSDKLYDEDVIFFETLHDEKKIRLNITDFNPAYNSELRIDIYNTMGSEVNELIYSGDGSDISIQLNTLEERHAYTGLELNCKPISSAAGGSNTPTIDELRVKVINGKSTVNSVDTDYDMIHFMESRDSTNDCVFIKKRNDIIERRYSCFMIPRLLEKDIIPTSTLDLCIPNFAATKDIEAHTYYNFDLAANHLNYNSNSPELYYKENNSFIGSQDINLDEKGEDDTGTKYYSISEKYYEDIKNIEIKNILITEQYSFGKNGFTKSSTYKSLYKYLLDNGINVNATDKLSSIYNLEFDNPLKTYDEYIRYFNYLGNENSNSDKYLFNLRTKRLLLNTDVVNTSIMPNEYKFKGKIYSISSASSDSKDAMFVPLTDVSATGNYFYNKLNEYSDSELYFPIIDPNGEYYFESGRYSKTINEQDSTRYSILNLQETIDGNNTMIYPYDDGKFVIYDKDSYDYVKFFQEGIIEEQEHSLLILDGEDYVKVYYGTSRYYINESLDMYNNTSDDIEKDPTLCKDSFTSYYSNKNGCYYYNIVGMEGDSIYANKDIYIHLPENLSDLKTINMDLYNYMINELALYIRYSNSDGNNIAINDEGGKYLDINANTCGSTNIEVIKNTENINDFDTNNYYYLYKSKVSIKDIPLFIATLQNVYSKLYEENFNYYIKNTDDIYLYRLLYMREEKNTLDDTGDYIYNFATKVYVQEISDTDIKGIVVSTDDAGNKVNITIKAGTPLLLKKDIDMNEDRKNELRNAGILNDSNESDILCDTTIKSYQYPILSINDFYNEANGYSGEGVNFYKDNTLMILNRYDQIGSDETGYEDKYNIDSNRGLYWNSNGISLEDVMKVYSLPYTIVYDIKNQIASFFLTSISRDVTMNMIEEETETEANFSIDSIHIERNATMEESSRYKITLTIMSNGDLTNSQLTKEVDGSSTVVNIANSIMLKGFIYDNDDLIKGYFDFERDETVSNSSEGMFTYVGYIDITDSISSSYFTTMKNMYSITELNTEKNELSTTYKDKYNNIYYIPTNFDTSDFLNLRIEDLRIGIGTYFINRSITSENLKSVEISDMKPLVNSKAMIVSENVNGGTLSYPKFVATVTYRIEDSDEDITIVEPYTLTNVYDNSMDLLDIYTDMSNFVKSAVQINELTKDADGNTIASLEMLHFTDIPVIQFSQCLSDTISDRITNVITNTNENLTDLSVKITNNFSIDYKFFRTYGPCRYFKLRSIGTQGDYNDIELGNLDVTMRFNLLIKTNLSISDNDVVNQLKAYIKQRVEELNDETDNDDYSIYISNIITDIENEFNDYVRSIELVSINNNDSSYRIIGYNKPDFNEIEYYTSTVTTEDIKEYVPEYINVPLDNITIDIRR